MSMPQSGEPGQSWQTGQQTGQQTGRPGQEWPGSVPSQAGPPDSAPGGAPSWAWTGESQAQQRPGPMPVRPISPVNEKDTRVTGRRVVQYIIDYVITAIVAAVIMWALDRGTGATNAVLLLVGAILVAAWYFWYWVYRPYHANGRSLGMQLLGIHVISKDGGRASMMQLFIRGILLIVDTFFWGLVGWVTIICSRYRQRVGDHAAKTVVVRTRVEATPARREYAGMAGSR